MKLIESDGKRVLQDAGIAIPRSVFIPAGSRPDAANDLRGAVYVKAQVLQGRRGRSGLVERCDRTSDVEAGIARMASRLGDTPVAGWSCEEDVPHVREWLLAMDTDRRSGRIRLTVSGEGGMDVAAAETFLMTQSSDAQGLPLPPGIRTVAERLCNAFCAEDMVHAEINPLAETATGDLIALDAKIELDDAASFRHPHWQAFHSLPALGRAPTPFESAYEAFRRDVGHRGTFGNMIELDGDIALILSGGGASLMALDALAAAGGRAANYCEFSGNPERDAVRQGAALMFRRPGIRGIWIAGSHANFTDILETVSGMLEAVEATGLRVPVVIRRDGPHAEEAERAATAWAASYGVSLLFHRSDVSLEASARELMRLCSI